MQRANNNTDWQISACQALCWASQSRQPAHNPPLQTRKRGSRRVWLAQGHWKWRSWDSNPGQPDSGACLNQLPLCSGGQNPARWGEMTGENVLAKSKEKPPYGKRDLEKEQAYSKVVTPRPWEVYERGWPLPGVGERRNQTMKVPGTLGPRIVVKLSAVGNRKKKKKKIENNTLPAFSSEIAAKICCLDPSVLIPSSFKSPSVSVRNASISTWEEKGGFATICSVPHLFLPTTTGLSW